jgi:hypothetical protein
MEPLFQWIAKFNDWRQCDPPWKLYIKELPKFGITFDRTFNDY